MKSFLLIKELKAHASRKTLNILVLITRAELKAAHARPACLMKGKEGKIEPIVSSFYRLHVTVGNGA